MRAPTPVCAGVDLGGTKIAVILGTKDRRILANAKIGTLPVAGPTVALERIAQLLERLAQESNTDPSAIGIGVPGLVDLDAGIIEFLPNLPSEWCGFQAREFLRRRTGKQVYLLNDARLAALGEYTFGVAALGELLLGPIRTVVRERVRMFPAACVHIVCSTLSDHAGALGGVALAFQDNIRLHTAHT